MLKQAFELRKLRAKSVLFDTWYASATNLKYVQRQGRIFYTTIKSNRRLSLSKEALYIDLQEIDWTPERLRTGIVVKLKEVPLHVKLFKLVATNGEIDWVITIDTASGLTIDIVRGRNAVRWDVACRQS